MLKPSIVCIRWRGNLDHLCNAYHNHSGDQIVKPFHERPTRQSRHYVLTAPILMRKLQIGITTLGFVLLLTACGSEPEEPPTSESEPAATATEIPTATPEPAPTEESTQVITQATKKPEPTIPPVPTEEPVAATAPKRDLDIVTLLPFDGIPAIDNPHFFPDLETANKFYNDGELVLGVEIDGDARAYSVPLLSSHEIVNDVVGGKPIAVTW